MEPCSATLRSTKNPAGSLREDSWRGRSKELIGLVNLRAQTIHDCMSCVCILTPVVIAAWPAFSAAVLAAASSLGYAVAQESDGLEEGPPRTSTPDPVRLEIAQSELVTGTLGRDRKIVVTRDGVTVTFSRDARGAASLCVSGPGHDRTTLTALGEELGQRVVQQFVYQKLMQEMQARQFHVVEEEVDDHHAIRLKVRHWETG